MSSINCVLLNNSFQDSLSELTTFQTISIKKSLSKNENTKVYEYTASKDEFFILSYIFGINTETNAIGQIAIQINGENVIQNVVHSVTSDLYNTSATLFKNLKPNDIVSIYVLKNTGGKINLDMYVNKENSVAN